METIEKQYLDCCKGPEAIKSPPKKRSKKKINKSTTKSVQLHLSELAATLHIDHFKKVCDKLLTYNHFFMSTGLSVLRLHVTS